MKYFTPALFLAVLLGGQHYNMVNAVKLRASTQAEDPIELAEESTQGLNHRQKSGHFQGSNNSDPI